MIVTLNFSKAPGHQVLAAAGKTILRPGGKAATEQLFSWANFQPNDTVLELASSFGESAIALAQRFNVRVVGVEKNPESVAIAQKKIQTLGLKEQVTIIEADIFQLNKITEKFDYVLAEAILTMQSPAGKGKILSSITQHLKPGGKYLAHEMSIVNTSNPSKICQSLSEAIKVNANPISVEEWQILCLEAGLNIKEIQAGKMGLLDLPQMWQDEGVGGMLKIASKLLTNPSLRQRVMTMRHNFQQHKNHLRYLVFWAEVKK